MFICCTKLLKHIVQEKADFFLAGQHASLQVVFCTVSSSELLIFFCVVQAENDLRDCEERPDAPIDRAADVAVVIFSNVTLVFLPQVSFAIYI